MTFDLDKWIRLQNDYFEDYAYLGRRVAKIRHRQTGDFHKIKWATDQTEAHLLKQEAIWLTRIFRSSVQVEQRSFQNGLFFLFDYIPGESLAKRLKSSRNQRNEIDTEMARVIVSSLFKHVSTLHEMNVVHGDIKPANILIENEKVVLIDFACAGWIGGNLSLKDCLSYTKSYALPSIEKREQYHTEMDWYAFLLVLDLLRGTTPVSLRNASFAVFSQHHTGSLTYFDFSQEEKGFLEEVIRNLGEYGLVTPL